MVVTSETRLTDRWVFILIFSGYEIDILSCQLVMRSGTTVTPWRDLDLKIRTIFLNPEGKLVALHSKK